MGQDRIKYIERIIDKRDGCQEITYEQRVVLNIPGEDSKPQIEPPRSIVKPLELRNSGWRTDIAVEMLDVHTRYSDSEDFNFRGSQDTIIFTPYFNSMGDATIPSDKLSKLKKHIINSGRERYLLTEVTIHTNPRLKKGDGSMLQRLK